MWWARTLFALSMLVLLGVGCGNVTAVSNDGGNDAIDTGCTDSAGNEAAPMGVEGGDGAIYDAVLRADRDAGDSSDGAGTSKDDAGKLLDCPQNGPLSYHVQCGLDGGTCMTMCRDNLAHPQVGCVSKEGWVCVADCGGCP